VAFLKFAIFSAKTATTYLQQVMQSFFQSTNTTKKTENSQKIGSGFPKIVSSF
jgi:hypothetical protein